MGVRLPAEYQEVEYLESTGTQWIDTGVIPRGDLSFDCKFITYSVSDPGYGNIFGSRKGSNDYEYQLTAYNYGIISVGTRSPAGFQPNVINAVSFDGNATVIVNGTEKAFVGSKDLSENIWPIFLFGISNRGVAVQLEHDRIYYCKFGRERYYVPCYRKSDSEPGMYDLVSKTFYTNQGTGEFLVGPDVVNHISPRLMDRRRALIAKLTSLFRKVITSQTGLASFDTNVAKPMKVTCKFSPKQDLHGYDNPWPAGGGKNKFNIANINSSATITGRSFYFSGGANKDIYTGSVGLTAVVPSEYFDKLISLAAGNYRLTATANQTCEVRVLSVNQVDGSTSVLATSVSGPTDKNVTFTLNESSLVTIRLSDGTTMITNLMVADSTEETSYAPYENICPIEAWDGANIYGTGNNIWDEETEKGYWAVNTGAKVDNNNYIRCANYIPVQPNTEYRFVAPERAYQRTFLFFSSSKNIISYDSYNNNPAHLITPNDCYYITFYVNSEYGSTYSNDISINYPATDTTYHAYHGTSLPITFNNPGTYDFLPVQAGTGNPSPENIRPITPGLTFTRDDNTTLEVWGGSLTVNADRTGSLTSAYYNLDCKSIIWRNANGASGDFVYFYNRFTTQVPECLYTSGQLPLCKNVEKYSHGTIENPYDQKISCACVFTTASRIGFAEGSGIDTIEKFNAWLDEQEVCQIVYPLKEPTTYTLSVAETSRAFEALGLGKNLGPLYGGTVTLNEDGSADLDSRWVIRNLGQMNDIVKTDGTGAWEHRFDCRHYISGSGYDSGRRNGEPDDIMCSALKWGNAASNGTYLTYSSTITVYDDTVSSVAEFREKYADVQICYVGNDYVRQQYHFDNLGQLQSFLGTNNIWSDLNGPITVEYYKKQQ